jgi:hypothetical protein
MGAQTGRLLSNIADFFKLPVNHGSDYVIFQKNILAEEIQKRLGKILL